ncbi:hypothetical protein B7988_13235 [Fibrobacter sp. UWB1]|nr:hypothetical protein B7988_13235 [Fibrobacter sp. UWB1]
MSTTLAFPTDLSVVKNGDNKWILFWNYIETEGRPEEAFIIETLNMSDKTPKWKTLDSTSADVTMFNLVGETKAGKYYRIMAKDQCGTSKPTDMIQVSTAGTGSTSASAELAVPTDLKLDTLGNNQWQLSWSYENNSNRPENGFQLQVLNLNDESPKWKDETSTNKGVHVIKIDGTKKGGLIYHVAAKDSNGVSEYSAEIRIPNATDDNTSNSNSTLELAVPTDLKVDSTNLNQWKLSWSYTNNKANPENGFVLQALNLEADGVKWTDAVSVNQGVHYILMDSKKYGGQYIRIAAKNADGKQRSAYSEEIMIPKPISEEATAVVKNDTLAVPTALKLDTLGENIWQISWSYTNNKANPEKGFKIQYLHPDTLLWKDYKEVAEGVHLIKVDAKQKGGCFFRIAALDAKKNTSVYSAEIQVPKYTENASVSAKDNNPLNVPEGLTLDSIGENKWKLSWKYTNSADRPENGFVIDTLNLTISNAQWSAMTTTSKGVRVFVFDNSKGKYSKLYVHVAAMDKNGLSEYSEEIQIPDYVDYSKPAATIELAVPTALKLDSIGENKWKLSWNYTNSARPENGFIVETYDLDGGSGTDWEEVKILSKGVHYYTFSVGLTDHMKLIHVLAKDADGKSEYSEGIQIPAYKDYSVPPPTIELAVPTNLQLDSIAEGKYQLTWDYSDNKDRPENGFVLQSMKPGDNNWTDNAATTKQGVHVIVIDALANNKANSGKFYRVAAIDKEGKLSDYSKEIQVPIVTDDGTSYSSTDKTPLAVPTNLAVEDLGSNKYKITWGYTNNENRPETKGFVLQKLDASATSPQWKDAGTTNKGVHFIVVTVSADDPEMTYRVAAKDSRGLSEYSATIVVPKYSPNAVADGCSGEFVVPSGLTPERIAPNVWRLVWNYNQNSKCKEEKFVIQKVDVKEKLNGEWEIIGTVPRNVHYMNLEGEDNLNFVYRVAAVRGDDTTKYSNEEILTRSTKYSDEYPFSTPKVKAKVFYTATITGTVVTVNTVEFMLIVEGNYPNHAMLYSDYTKQFDYQFRWNGESEADWKTVVVKNDGEYQTTLSKEYNGADKIKEFCRSYASVRTIWTQNDTDASKDYTEWSDPIGPLYGSVSTTFTYTGVDGDGNEVTKSIDVCK